jgi:ParB family chromosome partitioning protein
MEVAKKQQKRLGKGLGALLGDYLPEEAAAGPEAETLPVSALRPNPYQPREGVDRESLDGLVTSIRENGLLQPVLVRPVEDGGWQIVAGERRFRAVQELGWAEVPVVVREVDDRTMLVLALIENLQREDLSPLDEARAYRRLVDEFGLTQSQVAGRVGRDRSTVANTMRLLGLPEAVRNLVAAGAITAGHARALLGLSDQDRVIDLARAAAKDGLSVREVERRVRQRRVSARGKRPAGKEAEGYSSRGRIEVPFRDAEDFERIVEVIVGVGGVV